MSQRDIDRLRDEHLKRRGGKPIPGIKITGGPNGPPKITPVTDIRKK